MKFDKTRVGIAELNLVSSSVLIEGFGLSAVESQFGEFSTDQIKTMLEEIRRCTYPSRKGPRQSTLEKHDSPFKAAGVLKHLFEGRHWILAGEMVSADRL